MKLSDYLNIHKLSEYCREGYVQAKSHPTLPLVIYTYTRKTVFENHWDDVTERTRGLIVNSETGEIVSRPFEKFFNLDTHDRYETSSYHLASHPVAPIVTEKLDGNLAILYKVGSESGIASKGSFTSEHAKWGTAWYHKHCPNAQWPEGYTAVFECICESIQHHVVHYGGDKGLVLLALINNETGEELSYNLCYHYAHLNGLQIVDIHAKSVLDVMKENRPNAEGYVLTWRRPSMSPLRVKVKHEDFLKLQKLRNGVTRKSVFLALAEGDEETIQKWTHTEDPHLNERVQKVVDEYRKEYNKVFSESAVLVATALAVCTHRKEFAERFKQVPELMAIAFKMIDQENYKPAIWKLVGKRLKEKPVPGTEDDNAEEYDG